MIFQNIYFYVLSSLISESIIIGQKVNKLKMYIFLLILNCIKCVEFEHKTHDKAYHELHCDKNTLIVSSKLV